MPPYHKHCDSRFVLSVGKGLFHFFVVHVVQRSRAVSLVDALLAADRTGAEVVGEFRDHVDGVLEFLAALRAMTRIIV